jgi:hypothetical protein
MIYSIPLVTAMADEKNEEVRATLIFKTKAEKEDYVRNEYKFCNDARMKSFGVVGDTGQHKEEMWKKRFDFALQNDYAPEKTNKNIWTKLTEPAEPITA